MNRKEALDLLSEAVDMAEDYLEEDEELAEESGKYEKAFEILLGHQDQLWA